MHLCHLRIFENKLGRTVLTDLLARFAEKRYDYDNDYDYEMNLLRHKYM